MIVLGPFKMLIQESQDPLNCSVGVLGPLRLKGTVVGSPVPVSVSLVSIVLSIGYKLLVEHVCMLLI